MADPFLPPIQPNEVMTGRGRWQLLGSDKRRKQAEKKAKKSEMEGMAAAPDNTVLVWVDSVRGDKVLFDEDAMALRYEDVQVNMWKAEWAVQRTLEYRADHLGCKHPTYKMAKLWGLDRDKAPAAKGAFKKFCIAVSYKPHLVNLDQMRYHIRLFAPIFIYERSFGAQWIQLHPPRVRQASVWRHLKRPPTAETVRDMDSTSEASTEVETNEEEPEPEEVEEEVPEELTVEGDEAGSDEAADAAPPEAAPPAAGDTEDAAHEAAEEEEEEDDETASTHLTSASVELPVEPLAPEPTLTGDNAGKKHAPSPPEETPPPPASSVRDDAPQPGVAEKRQREEPDSDAEEATVPTAKRRRRERKRPVEPQTVVYLHPQVHWLQDVPGVLLRTRPGKASPYLKCRRTHLPVQLRPSNPVTAGVTEAGYTQVTTPLGVSGWVRAQYLVPARPRVHEGSRQPAGQFAHLHGVGNAGVDRERAGQGDLQGGVVGAGGQGRDCWWASPAERDRREARPSGEADGVPAEHQLRADDRVQYDSHGSPLQYQNSRVRAWIAETSRYK
eukprot:TRINITY_DN3794_c0_g1_i1.p1 TRINITY_DN3794_c0_g1~~TRINITY_DN3794_c0_g1_i1.p1  ORF type:complete len:555 (+),score=121.64 TRINITY_DN3794_c0_g1_i1:172-1836(+)